MMLFRLGVKPDIQRFDISCPISIVTKFHHAGQETDHT